MKRTNRFTFSFRPVTPGHPVKVLDTMPKELKNMIAASIIVTSLKDKARNEVTRQRTQQRGRHSSKNNQLEVDRRPLTDGVKEVTRDYNSANVV